MRHFSIISLLFLLVLVSCDSEPKEVITTPEEKVEFSSTLDSLNEAIVAAPNNISLYLERATELMLAGKSDEAYDDYERALRIDSSNAEIFHQRGNLNYILSDVKSAMDDFKTCLSLDGDHKDCLLKKAEIDLLLRNYSEALTNINNALRVDQNMPQAYFMKGILFKETGDTAASASSYATAIELDPEFYDAYIQVALLYADAKDDLALEYYNSALELRPTSTEALYNKGMFLQETGFKDNSRFRQAMECYRFIEDVDSTNAAASYNMGYIYLEYLAQYDSAATKFSDAISKYPTYFQAFYNRGLCFESLDRNDLALNDYNKALALRPDYTPAALAKGRVLAKQ